jgi:hypothetical protein
MPSIDIHQFAFFNCPCGYHFIINGGDESRNQRQRDMKMRLHKRSCSIKQDTQEITNYNTIKQTEKYHNNTQKLINQNSSIYGAERSAEQLQYNFIEMLNQY